jgi:hypothetical protein
MPNLAVFQLYRGKMNTMYKWAADSFFFTDKFHKNLSKQVITETYKL